jgi:hypothetical protein
MATGLIQHRPPQSQQRSQLLHIICHSYLIICQQRSQLVHTVIKSSLRSKILWSPTALRNGSVHTLRALHSGEEMTLRPRKDMMVKDGHGGQGRAWWPRKDMMAKEGHDGQGRTWWSRKDMAAKEGHDGQGRT